jgi:hypothetical protein
MTMINPTEHRPTTTVNGSPAVDSAGRPSPQLILDGVIAGYIHQISQRRPPREAAGDGRGVTERVALPG